MKYAQALAALIVAVLASLPAAATPGPSRQPDMEMTASGRQQLVDKLAEEVGNSYVFPERARKASAVLRANQKRGAYAGMTSARQLAEALTQELQATTGDRHLRVTYSEQPIPERKPAAEPSPEETANRLAMMRAMNFGVAKIEQLPFNIGYLDLAGFAPAADAAETVGAAMTVLAHTDALIIDLRNNGGGDAAAATLLASYLLDKRTQLNDFYYRKGDRIEQRWSADAVPGRRYGQKKEVVVLTSRGTFSAAEDFAYALRNLRRVTVVGETTAGGANPGDDIRLAPHFSAFIPLGRAISPITGTNWEGSGVTPDLAVCADGALDAAQVAILEKRMASENDPVTRDYLRQRIAELRAAAGCP